MTKTLRVDLADLEGIPHASGPSGTSVVVTAEYTSPVVLEADGKIILAPKSKTMGAAGRVDFDGIYASDSEEVREDHRGFAVRVKVAIREPNGATRTWSRTVKPLEHMTSTVRLGQMPTAEGVPPQWVTADDYVEAVVAAAAEGVAAMDRIVRDPITGRLYFDRQPVPPVFLDDFDRPDESPVTPTPVGGKPLLPLSPTTTRVEGGQLALGGATTRAAFWDAGQPDGVYTITVANVDRVDPTHGFGVIFRADTTAYQNALVLDGSGTGGTWRLRRRIAGAYTNQQLGGVVADGDVVEVTMAGPQVTIKVNGDTLYSDEPGPEFTGTFVGVQNLNNRNTVRFDNASFEQIGA